MSLEDISGLRMMIGNSRLQSQPEEQQYLRSSWQRQGQVKKKVESREHWVVFVGIHIF